MHHLRRQNNEHQVVPVVGGTYQVRPNPRHLLCGKSQGSPARRDRSGAAFVQIRRLPPASRSTFGFCSVAESPRFQHSRNCPPPRRKFLPGKCSFRGMRGCHRRMLDVSKSPAEACAGNRVVFSDSQELRHPDDFLRQTGAETGESASETYFGKAPVDRIRFGQPFGSQVRGKACCLDIVPPHGAQDTRQSSMAQRRRPTGAWGRGENRRGRDS